MRTVSSLRSLWWPLVLFSFLVFLLVMMRGLVVHLQVKSGLVTAPDRAVRTVQHTAVLCIVSETSDAIRSTLVHVQDA